MSDGPFAAGDVTRVLANPVYACALSPTLCGARDLPMVVSRETWLNANVRLIEDMGPRAYLELLLEILEAGA